MTNRGQHLHLDDHPAALALLAAVLEPSRRRHDTLTEIGYGPTEHGAWVDWDRLTTSWLSSTERAVIYIARGVARLERAGGPPPRLTPPLRAAIAAVTPELGLPAWMTGEQPMPDPVEGRDYVDLDDATGAPSGTTSSTRRFLVPDLDGEILDATRQVEDALTTLAAWRDDPDASIPATLGWDAADAAGAIAAAISATPAHSLCRPDGRYEHEPLAVVEVPEHALVTLAAAVAELAAAARRGDEPVCLVVADHDHDEPGQLVAAASRLLAVCELPWGDDEQLIAARLGHAGCGAEQTVLTDAEESAYNRIRDRLVRAWHDGDPLARWAY
jgi:hypothetical protein